MIDNKMTLVEIVNQQHFRQIIKNWKTLEKCMHSDLFAPKSDDNKTKYQSLYPILGKYLNKIKKISKNFGETIGEVIVEYKPSPNELDHLGQKYTGRVYPDKSISLVSMSKTIRNYCMVDTEYNPLVIDIDIVNAHPTIWFQWLLNEAKFEPHQVKMLSDYVSQRSNWIKKFGKEIKEIVIKTMNGAQDITIPGSGSGEDLELLINEIWNIHRDLKIKYNLTTLEQLKKFIYSHNTQIERKIIDSAMEYMDLHGIQIRMYAYDGFVIDAKPDRDECWLEELFFNLNAWVCDKTGYEIQFVDKPIKVDEKLITVLRQGEALLELENNTKFTLEPGQFIGDVIKDNIFETQDDIIIFKAGFGLGKSHKVYNDQRKIGGTCIAVLNRISLIGNIKFDYKWVDSYLEGEDKIIDGVGRTTVICTESLHRLSPETLKKCDYLLLDEFMSVLPQMQSVNTHKDNLYENQSRLWGLIRNAKKIIIMDANIEKRTIDFVKSIRQHDEGLPGKVKSYQFETIGKTKNIITYHSHWTMLNDLTQSVAEGKRVFIPNTRNVKWGSCIQQRIENLGKKILYINKETREKYDEYIRDTSKWVDFDVVMISPTITSGVSCVVKDWFDEVWCFFTRSTCNAYDSSQLIGRVRYPTTNNIYIHMDNRGGNSMYNKPWMNRDRLIQYMYNNQNDLYKYIDVGYDFTNFKQTIITNHRFELFAHNYEFQSGQYALFNSCLQTALENSYTCNWNVNDNEVDKDEDFIMLYMILREEESKDILEAKDITDMDADILRDEMQTDDPRYQKWKLKRQSRIKNFDAFVEEYKEHFGGGEEEQPDKPVYDKIKRHLECNVIPQIKKVKRIFDAKINPGLIQDVTIYEGLNPLNGDDVKEDETAVDNRLLDEILNFDLNKDDFNAHELTTTKDFFRMYKGDLAKAYYVEKILTTFFGSKYLWEYKSWSADEFDICREKFHKWASREVYTPVDNKKVYKKYKIIDRIRDLFDVNLDFGIKKNDPDLKFVSVDNINKILSSTGLSIKYTGSKKVDMGKTENGKRERKRKPTGYELVLDKPMIYNEYYLDIIKPDLKPYHRLNGKKPEVNINIDNLTLLYEKQPETLLVKRPEIVIGDRDIEVYKSSVFYHLRY